MKYWTLLIIFCINNASIMNAQKTYLFASGYTNRKNKKAIRVYEFNNNTGDVKLRSKSPKTINPGYFEISANGKYLYCANDMGYAYDGYVSAFKFDSTEEKLFFLNKEKTGGKNPCHIAVNSDGNKIAVTNYSESSMGLFDIIENGKLEETPVIFKFYGTSVNPNRQEASHVHSSNFSFDDKHIIIPDLGTDKLHLLHQQSNLGYKIYDGNAVMRNKLGSGPRHLAFHPNKKFVYIINELSGKVTNYTYNNDNGLLTEHDYTLSYATPQEDDDYGSADIHISPDGKFLYTSNRWKKENTIGIFKINPINGSLTLVGHEPTYGSHPRNFVIDPTGNFLFVANKHSNNIVGFKRNVTTGKLSKLNKEIKMKAPTCLKFKVYN